MSLIEISTVQSKLISWNASDSISIKWNKIQAKQLKLINTATMFTDDFSENDDNNSSTNFKVDKLFCSIMMC